MRGQQTVEPLHEPAVRSSAFTRPGPPEGGTPNESAARRPDLIQGFKARFGSGNSHPGIRFTCHWPGPAVSSNADLSISVAENPDSAPADFHYTGRVVMKRALINKDAGCGTDALAPDRGELPSA
jgi:hypothetical protein